MKKILLVAIVFLVIGLSGCSAQPFNGPAWTTFTENRGIEYYYDNGETNTLLFEWIFAKDYKYFTSSVPGNYDFTAINNYVEMSNECKAFLDKYEGYIVRNKFLNEDAGSKLSLSTGATSTSFNTVDVSADGEVYDVDDYIAVENGVRVVFLYTEFYHEGELIIVPYHLTILTSDIHEAVSKTYLGENNEYTSGGAVIIDYVTHVLPLPPKSVFTSTYLDGNEIEDLGYYQRVVSDESTKTGIEELCTAENTKGCFEPEYTSLSGKIYGQTIEEIKAFYTTLYDGHELGDVFVFTHDSIVYQIELIDLEQIDTGENIVSFEVFVY